MSNVCDVPLQFYLWFLLAELALGTFTVIEDYLRKTDKFWNINFTCLQVGSFLSADDLVRDPQPKKCVLMGLNKLQHSLVVGKYVILWLCK